MEPSESLLSISDVASVLGVSKVTVGRYVRDGTLDAIRLGPGDSSPVRIPSASLTRFLAEAREWQAARLGGDHGRPFTHHDGAPR